MTAGDDLIGGELDSRRGGQEQLEDFDGGPVMQQRP
jgi:hypothetical protein